MALSCLGSLNALEETEDHAFWHSYLIGKLPSADTMGRVFAGLDPDDFRRIPKTLYTKLKRNKALQPFYGNWFGLIIDGHETSASYLRHCKDCLERRIKIKEGERIQYYHRHVVAVLLCGNMNLPLDIEPQKAGEDEVAAALRLLERIYRNYPRAFDVILADGLYLRESFFTFAVSHHKHVIVVLKDEDRDLLKDARLLFPFEEALVHQVGNKRRECWDIEGFLPWFETDSGVSLRVVRTLEEITIHRQKGKEDEILNSEWAWASDIPERLLPTVPFVEFAHGRWTIENQGFNELANQWHFDHVYKHDLIAMINFWLMTLIVYILFHAFFLLNIKPQLRNTHSKLYFIRGIMADLLAPKPQAASP